MSLHHQSQHKKLLSAGAISLAIKVTAMLLQLLLAVVFARLLGVEGFGHYTFVLTLAALLAIPSQFGLSSLVVRETARAQVNRDWALLRGSWRWSGLMALAFSLLFIFLALILDGVWQGLTLTSLHYWGLALVPLIALGALRSAALRGLGHVLVGQLPETLLRPFFILVLVGLMLLVRPDRLSQPDMAMVLNVAAAAGAFLVGAWLLVRKRPAELKTERAVTYRTGDWVSSAVPMALTQAIGVINRHADILLLGLMVGAAEVGLYKVAAQGAVLVAFGLQAMNSVVATHFARLHAQGEHEKLQHLVTLSARVVLLIALPVVIGFVLLGESLLGWIFGTEYVAAYSVLVILALGQLVNAMMGSVTFLLNMTGHERHVMRGVTIAALINVGLNLLLIPSMGMEGAAIATAASLVVWNIYLWRKVRVLLGINSMAFAIQR